MATTADLIAETKRHLMSYQREPMNKLAAGITSANTSLTMLYPVDQIQQGSYIEIDLELMYVWSVDPGPKTVTVERAQFGSVAIAHDASDIVRVNPKFPEFGILKALNDEIIDLSSPTNGLYAVRTVDVTTVGARHGYELAGTTGLIDIIEVRYEQYGAGRQWSLLPSWSISRQVDATDFPSGLTLNTHLGLPAGRTMNVTYKGSFNPLVTLSDNVETVTGLSSTMLDIPPMGAAVRLVAPREIKRNFTEAQGEPRRANEVPAGATAASMRGVAALRANRIQSEANRLVAAYPTRFPSTHVGHGW